MNGFKFFLLASAAFLAVSCGNHGFSDGPYAGVPFDMPHVQRPVIPTFSVVLTDFGAVGDGVTLNTEAFAKAIDKLSRQGGGILVVSGSPAPSAW